MTKKHFDIIVIGAGPGGYPAAIRAAQIGKSVALVEAGELGGTCLNVGCIPSKTLIAGAEIWQSVLNCSKFGISVENPTFDYAKMVERKDNVVKKVRSGLEGLIKANKITLVRGFATFLSPKKLKIDGDETQEITGDKIIIATGSSPKEIPAFPFDGKRILNSTDILAMTKLPKSLVIIGGGVIGCEFASLFNALGVEVTVLEMMPRLIPMEAEAVSSALEKAYRKQGIKVEVGKMVKKAEAGENGVKIELEEGKVYEAELCLVAVGRSMNTDKIGLDKAGVKDDGKGNIPTNEKMETNVEGIYAIGDIASKWWLAHVASHQGLVAASNACGKPARMHYDAVPSVIFTHPEIATCGLSLEEAIDQGYDATVGAFPFQALGKSQASLKTEGFAQIVTDKKTHQILGAQIVGTEASTLIAEMAVAIGNELTVECITETIHAHPTVAEVWMEAALVAFETPLHLPPKR
ncbi:MAG: dihydrolipoyl dehydrogenase [Chlamydiia bacterium]|nr:dihydrolipoyl dehydrogenase [Chlamydiia bacterium]